MRVFYAFLAATLLLALASVQPGAAQAAALGQPIDGIRCESAEGSVFHIHQHLSLYARGKAVPVPAFIGIPPSHECLYWLHTHTADGLIHVESPIFADRTLGEFFDLWGQPLSATRLGSVRVSKGQLRAYVNQRRVSGDPRKIPLTTHADIVLEFGPPYFVPKPFTDWQGQ